VTSGIFSAPGSPVRFSSSKVLAKWRNSRVILLLTRATRIGNPHVGWIPFAAKQADHWADT
jgi:hypothetical protein